MTYADIEGMYLTQLGKPENYAKLEAYKADNDKSGAKFAQYTLDLFSMVRGTPAWGKPGTNKMLNKVLDHARAIMHKAKTGQTSAHAHAGKLIRSINYHKDMEASVSYWVPVKLLPELSEEELQLLMSV